VTAQGGHKNQPMSTQEYIASFQPRVSGFPHTAPRYDEVSKPVTAPYPAACMSMGQRCECYTQQGTKMETSPDICAFIVRRGYGAKTGATLTNRNPYWPEASTIKKPWIGWKNLKT